LTKARRSTFQQKHQEGKMKKATILCVCLLISGVVLTRAHGDPSQSNNGFEAFWQKFRTAIIAGDKEAAIGLSRFPIRMPGRVRNIKDGADLRLRYREVFNKYTSAAKCFGEKYDDPRYPESKNKYLEATIDSDNPKLARFNCSDNTGYYIDYIFELTRTGWRFVRIDRYVNQGRLFQPQFPLRIDKSEKLFAI
jgi:hypothetical protein